MVAFGPFLRNRVGVGNEMLKLRIGQLVADDAGGDIAVEQHLRQILAFRRALDDGRIVILGDMGILEGDPLNLIDVDAVIARQNSPYPRPCRHRIGAHANSLAVELGTA